ncbi:MAG: hypothetical protein MUF37_02535 [Methanoregulaceae archaeon]|jgi:hypothetical protein|nr:hypothetical protein [Methanoregulaceae archaeon]
MDLLDSIGGGMPQMLQPPGGQDTVKKFLASPEGLKYGYQRYLNTGMQTVSGKLLLKDC